MEVVAISCTVDYSGFLELAPSFSINGREAYERYIQHTLPYLADSGGELIYLGEGGNYFIGPEGEGCDLVMLERQSSLYDFISFASNEDYLKGVGHLAAAVRDFRIQPLITSGCDRISIEANEQNLDRLEAELQNVR